MNAPAPPVSSLDPPRTDSAAALFFRLLYGRSEGYIELAWIDGDPDDRKHHTFGRSWFAYRRDRLPILLQRIEELGQHYGNVYVSAQLYAAPGRNAPILPGQVVVVDDLPADVPCAFSVQTSPGSRHGYFLLDRPAPAAELRELARRAAYTLGGDRGGWDSQQLVRVPGTFNTKARHGGRFLVTLMLGTRQRTSAAELYAAWPEPAAIAQEACSLNWPEVEHWLGNLEALIGPGGLPRRVKPASQTGRVLLQGIADTSLARFIVAKGLALHGYPDPEIAALLWHYCDYGKAGEKGTAWLKADIQRVIAKVRAERPDLVASPTRARGNNTPQPLPERERLRRGRSSTLTPAELLAWYERERSCSDVIMLTIAEVTERLGVSRATVERCERTLRTEGQIERRTFNRRQSSMVVLLHPANEINMPSAPAIAPDSRPLTIVDSLALEIVSEGADQRPITIADLPDDLPSATGVDGDRRPITIQETTIAGSAGTIEEANRRPLTIEHAQVDKHEAGDSRPFRIGMVSADQCDDADSRPFRIAKNHPPATPHNVPSTNCDTAQQNAENPVSHTDGGTHPPEGRPSTALAARLPSPRAVVAEAFDYFARRRRITRQMVVMFLDSAYPGLEIPLAALNRLISAERERRAWGRQVDRLGTMPYAQLSRLSKRLDRLRIEGPEGPDGKQYGWACALAPAVEAELERRADMNERADPKRLRRRRQEEQALADQILRQLREERRRGGRQVARSVTTGRVCSPQQVATQHELFGTPTAPPSAAEGLIARLRALKGQHSAGVERSVHVPP